MPRLQDKATRKKVAPRRQWKGPNPASFKKFALAKDDAEWLQKRLKQAGGTDPTACVQELEGVIARCLYVGAMTDEAPKPAEVRAALEELDERLGGIIGSMMTLDDRTIGVLHHAHVELEDGWDFNGGVRYRTNDVVSTWNSFFPNLDNLRAFRRVVQQALHNALNAVKPGRPKSKTRDLIAMRALQVLRQYGVPVRVSENGIAAEVLKICFDGAGLERSDTVKNWIQKHGSRASPGD